MRWQVLIDGYDWKARLIPTAIILLPSFSTIYFFCPRVIGNPLQLAGSSLLAFAVIYLASMYFRDLGVRHARKFWEKRGGLPSTRFGRMRDSFLSHDQKSRIQRAVLNRFSPVKTVVLTTFLKLVRSTWRGTPITETSTAGGGAGVA